MQSQVTLMVNDQPTSLRLSLAALSRIEEALEASNLVDLAGRLANPSAAQLITVLTILAEAAEDNELIPEMGTARINLKEALQKVSHLFHELLTGEVPGKPLPDPDSGPVG